MTIHDSSPKTRAPQTTGAPRTTAAAPAQLNEADWADPRYQAFSLLRVAFILAPLLAGIDKYTEILVDWNIYLAPEFPDLFGISGEAIFNIIGAVEIVAALVVAFAPRIGGYLVAAWMAGIIVNLFILGNFYDVALRDLGLLLGALALARLATAFPAALPTRRAAV